MAVAKIESKQDLFGMDTLHHNVGMTVFFRRFRHSHASEVIKAVGAAVAVFVTSLGAVDASSQDAVFVRSAAQDGLAEVQAAAMARRKSSTPAVVMFATRMRDDHTRANAQLTSIAKAQGFAVPAGIGAANRKQLSQLASLDGHAFDVRYLTTQLRDHQRVLALFKHEASAGNNTYLVSFAQQIIPVLDQHIFIDRRAISAVNHRR